MIKPITSVKVKGKRVIVRAGFDVPLKQDKHGHFEVADNNRLKEALPTIKHLIKEKAKIIILSKLGRPEGKWDESLSQWPVAQDLAKLLNYKIVKVENTIPEYAVPQIYFLTGDITKKDYSEMSKKVPDGSILYLENMFFYKGELENDSKFVDTLNKFGDIYVEEAFPSVHHKAASNYGLPRVMPSYGGLSLIKELQALNRVIHMPTKPMIVIMGGAKIDDKVETLHNLAKHAHKIILGGAIANTFLKAKGYEVGVSRVSNVSLAKQLLRQYQDKIILPVDLVVATSLEATPRLVKPEKIRANESIYDIGPETIRNIASIIKTGKTLVWNGPFGVFENPRYAYGSRAIAQAFATQSKGKAFGVVGGGETVELVNQTKVGEFIDHLSTGGGAMLEFMSGKDLPAIKVLEK